MEAAFQVSGSQNDKSEFDEFCPECGQWKPLISETGWCLNCTRRHHPDRCYCESCGESFNGRGQVRRKCQSCIQKTWQESNADRIEQYIGIGLTYELAAARVAWENRPLCNCCGNRIKHGTKGRSLFCRTTAECRKAGRRYKWYRTDKGMNRDEALQAVIKTLT